jgi:alkylation response protein AidB-like acyl-CoA dehydrogenase
MDFSAPPRHAQLRAAVADALADPALRGHLDAITGSDDREPDVRPLYRALGQRQLLAPAWPAEYGGRGTSHAEAATVIAEMVLAGMPDTLHVLSVQIVGTFLMLAGSPEQRARHLPAMAAGERFATVLYTEPGSGSDLASLTGTATRTPDGYVLNGLKVYGMKSRFADYGLCAMRTGAGGNKYDGISLFLVDLTTPGIRRGHLASMLDEQFDHIELTDVRVGTEALVGAEGDGWGLLTRCLTIERTGLDYTLKAQRWLAAAMDRVAPAGDGPPDDGTLAAIGRHRAAIGASRLLVGEMLGRLDRGVVDETAAAIAKHHSSEASQRIARWASTVHGFGYGTGLTGPAVRELEAAYREAAGVTMAAGTSQIMLEIIANSALEPGVREKVA